MGLTGDGAGHGQAVHLGCARCRRDGRGATAVDGFGAGDRHGAFVHRFGALDAHEGGIVNGLSGALQVGLVLFVGFVDGGLVEHGEAGGDVEFGGWFEVEGAGGVGRGVAAVEQRDGGEVEAAVGHDAGVDERGEVERAGELQIEAHAQHAFELTGVGFGGGEDEFKEDGRIFFRAGEGDHAVGKEVVRAEAEGAHDVEIADNVGDEVFGALVVAQVVAEEDGVLLREIVRGQVAEAFEKFVGVEELSARGFGQLEAFRLADFSEGAEDAVAERFFRMPEDVEAADPRDGGEGGKQQEKNCPTEKVVLSGVPGADGFSTEHGGKGGRSRALSRAVGPCMKT